MRIALGRKSLMKFGMFGLAILSLALVGYFFAMYVVPAFGTIDETRTYVNTTVAPDKLMRNGTAGWVNFTVKLTNGNVSYVNITIPNTTTAVNFFVQNATAGLIPTTNDTTRTWMVTYPENRSGMSGIILFNTSNGTAFTDAVRFDLYVTPQLAETSDNLTQAWNISVLYNGTQTINRTTVYTFVDSRAPVFNTTTPANQSFISGNNSQLFQVYVYDLNMNTSNVTLRWKKSDAGNPSNWTTGTKIPCYAQTSPLFICNTTIDSLYDTFGNSASFSFYFDGSDNAIYYGNNGTSTAPLNTTIDRTAPTNTSTSREKVASGSKYDTTDAANYYGFETDWTDAASGVSKVLFESNFTGAGAVKANTTATKSGSTYYVNFSQHNFKQAGGYVYRWYANDSVAPTTDANWAVTSNFAYTIAQADNPATLYLNDTANANVGDLRYPATVNATGAVTAGEVVLYRNSSGVWTDVSVAENKANMTLPVGTHAYTVNTTGNANYTANNSAPSYYAVVGKGIVTLNLRLNTTTQANYSIVYPANVNATGNKSATTGSEYNISLYRDGVIVSTSTSANKVEEDIQLANGTYNYTVVFDGSANYTNASVTAERFVLVSKGPTTLALLLNGTAANITVARGAYVSATVTVNHTTEGNTTHNITLYMNNALYNSSSSLTAIENISAYADVPATVFNITGSYPEAQNYSAASGTYYVIIESTAPTYADNYTNVTASVWGKYQGVIGINAAWNDGYNVSRTWLRSNETGAWALTNGSFTGTPKNVSNFTINPSNVDVSLGNAVVFGSIYANDTSNNINSTLNYTWTIDGVAPALSSPSPSNQSYVYTNNSYPFSIVVSDNTLNRSNATAYWKLFPGGAYSSGLMTCTGAAPAFTCNRSIDLSIYGEGGIITYYFEASDNSSLLGRTGNYNVTLDTRAPAYSNNETNRTVIGKYDAVKISSNWTDADTLDTFLVEFTVGGDRWNVTEAKFASLGPSNTWSNYSYPGNSTGDWVPGTSIGWRIFANDTVPNWNVTTMVNFTIDNAVPTYSNNGTNVTSGATIAKGDAILAYAAWTDNVNISNAWVQENFTTGTTTFANTSVGFAAGNWTNYTLTTSTLTVGALYQARIFANDTSGNENYTSPTWQWTIDGTRPTWSTNLTNVTNATTIVKGTVINLTAIWADNVGLHKYWLQSSETGSAANGTVSGFPAGNLSDSLIATSGASFDNGETFWARIFANDTSGNENVTGNFTWTIDGTVPTPANVTRNDASGNGTSEYAPGKTYIFNVSWTDNLGGGNVSKVLLNFSYSATNYTADVLGSSNYSVSVSDLPAGDYWYKWFANDTSGNWNSTAAYSFNVTANATNPINLYLNDTPNANITLAYPATVNATYVAVYSNSGWPAMYRISGGTETDVTSISGTKVTLGNGTYEFKVNMTGTANYTSNATGATYRAIVERGVVTVTLLLNGTGANLTASYPAVVNVTGTMSGVSAESMYNLTLWRDGTIINSTDSSTVRSEIWQPIAKEAGYNYTLTFTSTNYTNTSSDTTAGFAIVSKGISNISMWMGNATIAEANATVVQGQTLNITATINTTYFVTLMINTTLDDGWVNQSTENTRLENLTRTSGFTVANNYNITANFAGDANFTADSQTWWLNVTQDITGPAAMIYDNVFVDYRFDNATAKKSGATFSLNLSVSDAGIGVPNGELCNVVIGNTAAGSVAYAAGWCNLTVTVPAVGDGPRLLNITVNDTNDNMGFNDTYYITVDSTPPILTITIPPINGTYNKSDSSGYIWINGTVSDNLQMGVANVSINGTYFNNTPTTAKPFNFTGGNSTAFAYRNTSAMADGLYTLVMNYTDNATNIGNTTVYFYVDNTPPSAVYGLTNSSSQTYGTTTSQTIEVQVVDTWQTNRTITLNYYINSSWQTAVLTGTPSTSTTYSGSISTIGDDYKVDSAGRAYIPYYVTGADNATNPMSSNNGSASSPLANLTFGSTGTIQGYIRLTNTTIAPNSTSVIVVSDGTITVPVNTAGFYQIGGVTAGTYTVTVSGTGYWTNTSSVTVTAGATNRTNISVTGAENFNVTIPGSSTSSATVGTNGFLDSGWHAFKFRTDVLSSGTTNYTIEYLFSSIGQGTSYNYSSVWRYNSTSGSWASFIPKQTNTWVNITSGDEQYYVRANATDRVEIEPRYA